MSEQPPNSSGIISQCELEELAKVFDLAEHPLDPTSSEAKEAAVKFEALLGKLYVDKAQPQFPGLSSVAFATFVRSRCREIVRRRASSVPKSA